MLTYLSLTMLLIFILLDLLNKDENKDGIHMGIITFASLFLLSLSGLNDMYIVRAVMSIR